MKTQKRCRQPSTKLCHHQLRKLTTSTKKKKWWNYKLKKEVKKTTFCRDITSAHKESHFDYNTSKIKAKNVVTYP